MAPGKIKLDKYSQKSSNNSIPGFTYPNNNRKNLNVFYFGVLMVFIPVLTTCTSQHDKNRIAEQLVIDKCGLIEKALLGADHVNLSATICVCTQDKLIRTLMSNYSVKELTRMMKEPLEAEDNLKKTIEQSKQEYIQECLQVAKTE